MTLHAYFYSLGSLLMVIACVVAAAVVVTAPLIVGTAVACFYSSRGVWWSLSIRDRIVFWGYVLYGVTLFFYLPFLMVK